MDGDYSKTPEFRDETELQDTGQYGWQRFRKPLLYPGKQMDAGTKDVSPMGIDRQFSHLPAGLNNQGLIEGEGTIQSAGGDHGSGNLHAAGLSEWCRTIAIVCGSALTHTILGFQPRLAGA